MNELVTNVRSRKWMEMIHNQKESGLSVKNWCQQNGVSQHCYYYRLQKLRELMGSEIPKLVEIKVPKETHPEAEHIENNINNTAAYIRTGDAVIGLTNDASEELISRIVRVLHA